MEVPDVWIRKLDPSRKYTVKSLIVDLLNNNGNGKNPLFEIIWKVHFLNTDNWLQR